jgi:hypothetical protein
MSNEKLSNEAQNPPLSKGAVRHSADVWWRKLNHEKKVKYATEQLNKKGMIFKYNNDGLISGLTLSDVVELFRHYA